MYFREIGIVLIILSGGGCGIALQNRYLSRVRLLDEFIALLEQLKGNLRHQNYTMEENLLALKKSEGYRAFFSSVLQEMNDGKRFADAWESGCKNQLEKTELAGEDVEEIERFGRELGISDLKSQLDRIDFYEEQLKRKLGRLNQEKKERCRLYLSLGFMGGIMAGIILI